MTGAKIINFRPVAFAAVFLCLGIFSAVAVCFYELPVWILSLAFPFLALFYKGKRKNAFLALSVLFIAYWVGFGLSFHKITAFQNANQYVGEEYQVSGSVDFKTKTDYGYTLVLSDIKIGGKVEEGKVFAYLPASFSEKLSENNRVMLKGSLETSEVVSTFDSNLWHWLCEDIRYVLKAEECVVMERPFSLFVFIRERIESVLYAGMDETPAALTMAVLTGNTDGIERGLLDNMRRGGIAHVFAVSGLHIGALFAFVLLLIHKTPLRKLSKLARFAFATALLLFYGGVCGFSASITRAITLCLCFYACKLIGLGRDSLEVLGLSAIAVLVMRPLALFEVGFRLSFSACLGIMLLARPIERLCYQMVDRKMASLPPVEQDMQPPSVKGRMKRACISFLSVSLSAQIATAPISLAYFGYLSYISLFLNFLFVPLISVCFSALLSIACIASVFPIAWSGAILYAPSVAWSAVVLLFQTVDFSVFCIEGLAVPISALIAYFLGLSFLSDKWNFSKRMRYACALACFLIAFCCIFNLNVL